jgi:hypothetical protein
MTWVCWLFGHRWVFLFGSMDKHIALAHRSPRAGEDHFCVRCGLLDEDARSEHRASFYAGELPDGADRAVTADQRREAGR